jgi:hypothetical protein
MIMKRLQNTAVIWLVCAALFVPRAQAQQNAPAPPKIDPDAMDALRRMGEYLRTLDQFQVNAAITHDEVLVDSQKVQFFKQVDVVVDRPGRLRMQVKSDEHERLFTYDGSTFTMFAPRTRYYASISAPPSIVDLAQKLEEDYGIELPLIDLFRWGTSEAQISDITAAKNLGPSECGGLTCQHYAFRQDGLDWQVWIQNGDYPLPRKVVLTTRTDEARPQHSAIYTWNLAPSFNEESFVFAPPPDAKKITMADVKAKRDIGQK